MRVPGALLLAILCTSCGGAAAPTTPTPPVLTDPFLTGQYFVQLSGRDFSSDPLIPPCPEFIGTPRAGKLVTVALTVAREGTEWVGRSPAGPSDMELRFRDAGITPTLHRAFSGTLRGRGFDQQIPTIPVPPNGVSVSASGGGPGGAAIVEGETVGTGVVTTLIGRATGEFRYEDAAGPLATCGTVAVQMTVPIVAN